MLDDKFSKTRAQRPRHSGGYAGARGSKIDNIYPPSSPNEVSKRGQPHRHRERRRPGAQYNKPGSEPFALLEADLRTKLAENALTANDEACIDQCVSELQAMVANLGSEWSLKLFGSVANGFGIRTSDIDATCLRAEPSSPRGDDPLPSDLENSQTQAESLERLLPFLQEHPKFDIVDKIFHAKVPILKLRFDGQKEIDLSIHNNAAVKNTRLLHAYQLLDPRVRDVAIAVKLWAKGAGVCGATQGNLSSYSFTLLVIYFLQVDQFIRLPCLPPSAFEDFEEGNQCEGKSKLEAARSTWTCRLGSQEILNRFFLFYSNPEQHTVGFQWGQEVVCPRLGHRLKTHEPFFEKLRGRWHSRLHIEDPYKLERNLHCVLGEMEEQKLISAFRDAFYSCQMGGSPVGLASRSAETVELSMALEAEASETPVASETPTPAASPMAAPAPPPAAAAGLEAPFEVQKPSGNVLSDVSTGEESGDPLSTCSSLTLTAHADARARDESRESSPNSDAVGALPTEVAKDDAWQWWRHLGSTDVAEAMAAHEPTPKKKTREPKSQDQNKIRPREGGAAQGAAQWVTVQDLEGGIGKASSVQHGEASAVAQLVAGRPFARRATGVINARVRRACQQHVARCVAVQ